MNLPMVFELTGASIRDAMLAIQEGTANAAFAVRPDGGLVGVVTDGDIRRALLEGTHLLDQVEPLIRTNPVVATEAESRSAVLDLMQSRGISQVPVIDDRGRLVGVHLMRELLGRIDRPNLAVIMAGGRGARLQPVTNSIPKPMVPVAGRPILERIVNHLVGFGITNIVLSVGYLAEVIESYFGDGESHGCRIHYVREDPSRPLGTGGPLAVVHRQWPSVGAPVMVLNGDLLTQFDVAALLTHHAQSQAVATIASFTYSHEVPFGVLQCDPMGAVRAIVEKPTRIEKASGGIYVLNPDVLANVPVDRFVPMTQILAGCIERDELVTTWSIDQDWLDVGRPQDLARARGLEQ